MRREWRVQRVGWVVLALIVVGALAGLFGPGPLSWSSASTADGTLTVKYARFARNGGPVTLHIQVASSAAVDGQVRVLLDSGLLESLELQQIVPEPESQAATGNGVILTFALAGDVALDATVSATGDAMGWQVGGVGLAGQSPIELGQFFYP